MVAAIGLGVAGLVAIIVPDSFVMVGVVLAGAVWTVVWAMVGLARGEQAARDVSRRAATGLPWHRARTDVPSPHTGKEVVQK